ncbi:MAG: hypothetical protein QXL17_02785 [Candidatus Thermoplasmatota archaeon]
MRVEENTYIGYRNRVVYILTKILKSKYCLPQEHFETIKEFFEYIDGAESAGKFKKENEAALRNMEFSRFNIRHGYKHSLIGFISEQISMAYDYHRCQYVRNVHDSHEDNVKRAIDYYTKDATGKEQSIQVKTGQFRGNTIELKKDWLLGSAEYLHIVDIDDRRMIIFKMSDFKKLAKNGVVRLSAEQLNLLAKNVDLSDMY